MKQDWGEEGGEREKERKRERRWSPCDHAWYMCILDTPKKEISTILVFNILLQVDLFPMKVGALSPFCCVSTEPG